MLTAFQQTAVASICQAAWLACKPDQQLAAFTAAQCIYESFYLTRAPGNNCFGIKVDAHGSGTQYVLTHEYIDGTWEEAPLAFETYSSLSDCFSDHARLIQSGVYLPAWNQYQVDKDIDAFISGVSLHYATDPPYAAQMIAETHSSTVQDTLQKIVNN